MMGAPLHMRPYMSHLSASGFFESSDDRHVKAKDEAIRPNQSEFQAIEGLVSLIEKSLKGISDNFAEEAKKAASFTQEVTSPSLGINASGDAKLEKPITPPVSEEPERLLKGVMRVGLLAKKLLLNTDKEVFLIIKKRKKQRSMFYFKKFFFNFCICSKICFNVLDLYNFRLNW